MKQRLFIFLIIFLFSTAFIFAQDDSDEDSLFGGDDDLFGGDLIEEIEESDESLDELLLQDEDGIHIGGYFSFAPSGGFIWDTDVDLADANFNPYFEPNLYSRIYFDARPNKHIRVFGKALITYPFTLEDDDLLTTDVDEAENFTDIVKIYELFTDFKIYDLIYLRAGKQTINWGVGYFFSPANLLNLSQIDPQNPDEELEGPLSLQARISFNLNNLYLYFIIPEDIELPNDIAIAPKFEFVLGSSEIGIGGYYRYEYTPAGMITLSTSLWDFNIFAEIVTRYGSDKRFVEEDGSSYRIMTYDAKFFAHATAGLSYSYNSTETDFAYSVLFQYYFNGEGYSDPAIIMNNSAYILPSIIGGNLFNSDLQNPSMHYAALNLSITPIEDLSVSVFLYGNLTDFSGLIKPSVNYSINDYLSINTYLQYIYGEDNEEFTALGNNLMFNLGVSIGNLSF